MGIIEFLLGFLALTLLLYYYLTATYDFWKSRGIAGPKPILFFGNVNDIFFGKNGIGTFSTKVCEDFKNQSMIGIFSRRTPILIVRDPELIRAIMIKDFNIFANRSMEASAKHDPLLLNLFFLDAERWRPLRTKLTPVFTSRKMKDMFYLLKECGEQMDKYLDKVSGTDVELRDVTNKFTTEVIGMCAFGVRAKSFDKEESVFIKMGKKIFSVNLKTILRAVTQQLTPGIYEVIGGIFRDRELEDFFINLARDTMEYRETHNEIRHDFIDLMRDLRKEKNELGENLEMTDTLIAAQLCVFFVGGSETSATTISNCLYELAMNPDIQDKLRSEIREELSKTKGEITYEGLHDMSYLDKVVNETLRKYPPVTIMSRKSSQPYTFPGTKITIPAGTKVWIPVFSIHRDEKHYPNPDIFDPERFNDEEVQKRSPQTYLPFGDGPRNCIAARFGRIQTKYGIINILQNYSVEVCDKTDKEYKIHPRTMFLTPINGIHLRIVKSPLI